MTPPATLHAVFAMAANRVIGRGGRLPWHLPVDLKFFRRLTAGHPVLMGRKTWESLGRPLPNRRNLVLSRSLRPEDAPGAEVLRSVEEFDALGIAGDVFVIGGAEVFRLLLPGISSVYLTVLEADAEGDVWLPEFEAEFPRVAVIDRLPGVAEWRRYER